MTFEEFWAEINRRQGDCFYTARGLEFTYVIRGCEMFVNRKRKSVTKATVQVAYERAQELEWVVSGPKKLRCFGASYLYPLFLELDVVKKTL